EVHHRRTSSTRSHLEIGSNVTDLRCIVRAGRSQLGMRRKREQHHHNNKGQRSFHKPSLIKMEASVSLIWDRRSRNPLFQFFFEQPAGPPCVENTAAAEAGECGRG